MRILGVIGISTGSKSNPGRRPAQARSMLWKNVNNTQDTLLYNARIGSDNDALLMQGGRITWVGRAGEQGSRCSSNGQPDDARILPRNMRGRRLLPGFHDNHVHALTLGDLAGRPDLTGLDEAAIRRVVYEAIVSEGNSREPFLAFGWDYPGWPDPHRRVLDEVAGDRPVALFQFSGHGACVNTAMLKVLKIDDRTPDPAGGVIVRDSAGSPTGVLRDAAANPIHQKRFFRLNMNRAGIRTRFLKAFEIFNRHGITSIGDNTWLVPSVWVLNRMRRQGELTCRVHSWPYGASRMAARTMALARYDGALLRRGPWKYFLDGAFSTHTAWLCEAYENDAGNVGTPVLHGDQLRSVLGYLTRSGRSGAFHAIGDRAVKEFLDSSEATAASDPDRFRSLRHRLEHVQIVQQTDIPRFAGTGVLVAAQPHAIGDMEKDIRLIGEIRARQAYPYRSLLDAGAALSFGSDAPAEPTLAPLEGIHKAVNRDSDQRVSVEEAIRCYTEGSAYAEGSEQWKGRLEPGYAADIVALSEDIYAVPAEAIRTIKVDETILNGRVVFSRVS